VSALLYYNPRHGFSQNGLFPAILTGSDGHVYPAAYPAHLLKAMTSYYWGKTWTHIGTESWFWIKGGGTVSSCRPTIDDQQQLGLVP
jgi:hypothetical protein